VLKSQENTQRQQIMHRIIKQHQDIKNERKSSKCLKNQKNHRKSSKIKKIIKNERKSPKIKKIIKNLQNCSKS